MDEKGATNLCDLLKLAAVGDSGESAPLPMYLIVLSGGIPGAMLRLSSGGTRLGRAPDNSLQLPESSVSRYHAFLKVDDDGMARITDLGSTNGTYLNGERVSDHAPVILRDGDRLRFGSTVVVKFVRPDPCEERFQREMFDRTVRDALTGLYNRTFFLDQVGPLADRGHQKGLGLAVLMLDIDHFKHVNDTYGHDAGDTVLREVAAVLRQSTRSEDLVARYGGEEFILALPVSAPDQATERAERLRRNLASRRIHAEGASIRVTASIGLAFAPANRTCPITALISVADQCLYQAKYAGRDRVMVGGGNPTAPPDGQAIFEGTLEMGREGRVLEL